MPSTDNKPIDLLLHPPPTPRLPGPRALRRDPGPIWSPYGDGSLPSNPAFSPVPQPWQSIPPPPMMPTHLTHPCVSPEASATAPSPLPRPARHCPLSCRVHSPPAAREDSGPLTSGLICHLPRVAPPPTPPVPSLPVVQPCWPCSASPVSQAWACLMALAQAKPLPGMLLLPFSSRDQLKRPQHPPQ